jgi:hypothetical protein
VLHGSSRSAFASASTRRSSSFSAVLQLTAGKWHGQRPITITTSKTRVIICLIDISLSFLSVIIVVVGGVVVVSSSSNVVV